MPAIFDTRSPWAKLSSLYVPLRYGRHSRKWRVHAERGFHTTNQFTHFCDNMVSNMISGSAKLWKALLFHCPITLIPRIPFFYLVSDEQGISRLQDQKNTYAPGWNLDFGLSALVHKLHWFITHVRKFRKYCYVAIVAGAKFWISMTSRWVESKTEIQLTCGAICRTQVETPRRGKLKVRG